MYDNKELLEIENIANIKLDDIYNCYPVPVGDICDKLGIEVVFDETMENDYYGSIKYEQNESKYIISVNGKHSTYNNVFTIAHELGHFVKHREDVISKGFADRKKTKYTPQENKKEREANNFAANLLMPEDKFTEVFEKTNGNILILQNTFRVSKEAAHYRAINLSLGSLLG